MDLDGRERSKRSLSPTRCASPPARRARSDFYEPSTTVHQGLQTLLTFFVLYDTVLLQDGPYDDDWYHGTLEATKSEEPVLKRFAYRLLRRFAPKYPQFAEKTVRALIVAGGLNTDARLRVDQDYLHEARRDSVLALKDMIPTSAFPLERLSDVIKHLFKQLHCLWDLMQIKHRPSGIPIDRVNESIERTMLLETLEVMCRRFPKEVLQECFEIWTKKGMRDQVAASIFFNEILLPSCLPDERCLAYKILKPDPDLMKWTIEAIKKISDGLRGEQEDFTRHLYNLRNVIARIEAEERRKRLAELIGPPPPPGSRYVPPKRGMHLSSRGRDIQMEKIRREAAEHLHNKDYRPRPRRSRRSRSSGYKSPPRPASAFLRSQSSRCTGIRLLSPRRRSPSPRRRSSSPIFHKPGPLPSAPPLHLGRSGATDASKKRPQAVTDNENAAAPRVVPSPVVWFTYPNRDTDEGTVYGVLSELQRAQSINYPSKSQARTIVVFESPAEAETCLSNIAKMAASGTLVPTCGMVPSSKSIPWGIPASMFLWIDAVDTTALKSSIAEIFKKPTVEGHHNIWRYEGKSRGVLVEAENLAMMMTALDYMRPMLKKLHPESDIEGPEELPIKEPSRKKFKVTRYRPPSRSETEDHRDVKLEAPAGNEAPRQTEATGGCNGDSSKGSDRKTEGNKDASGSPSPSQQALVASEGEGNGEARPSSGSHCTSTDAAPETPSLEGGLEQEEADPTEQRAAVVIKKEEFDLAPAEPHPIVKKEEADASYPGPELAIKKEEEDVSSAKEAVTVAKREEEDETAQRATESVFREEAPEEATSRWEDIPDAPPSSDREAKPEPCTGDHAVFYNNQENEPEEEPQDEEGDLEDEEQEGPIEEGPQNVPEEQVTDSSEDDASPMQRTSEPAFGYEDGSAALSTDAEEAVQLEQALQISILEYIAQQEAKDPGAGSSTMGGGQSAAGTSNSHCDDELAEQLAEKRPLTEANLMQPEDPEYDAEVAERLAGKQPMVEGPLEQPTDPALDADLAGRLAGKQPLADSFVGVNTMERPSKSFINRELMTRFGHQLPGITIREPSPVHSPVHNPDPIDLDDIKNFIPPEGSDNVEDEAMQSHYQKALLASIISFNKSYDEMVRADGLESITGISPEVVRKIKNSREQKLQLNFRGVLVSRARTRTGAALPEALDVENRVSLGAALRFVRGLKARRDEHHSFVIEPENVTQRYEKFYNYLVERQAAGVVHLAEPQRHLYVLPMTEGTCNYLEMANPESPSLVCFMLERSH